MYCVLCRCKYQQTYLFYRFRVIINSPILIDIGTENRVLCLYHFVENITWYRKEINTCTLKYHGKHVSVSKRSQTSRPANFEGHIIPHICILYVWIENAKSLRTDSRNRKEPYSDLFTKRKEPYSRSLEIRTKISSFSLCQTILLRLQWKRT